MKWRRRFAVASLVVIVAYLAFQQFQRWRASKAPAQLVQASVQQLQRGRYIADAGDCAGCHTAAGGARFAGGVPLRSPFGTFYGTNLTPDPDHGIGRYTADAFYRAVSQGVARDGRHLYPAMPYVSYRSLSRADSDALYAYLMNQTPVPQKNIRHDIAFPFNIREGLLVWSALFGRSAAPSASTGDSAEWKRGRYLVDTLGHCGECHTPRGALGQMNMAQWLQGNPTLGRFAAPDITPTGLASRGWTAPDLRAYLSTGASSHAVASDEMLTVVTLSTSRLSPDDVAAMTTYLLGDRALANALFDDHAQAADPYHPIADGDADAAMRYAQWCSGCHGAEAQGVPNVAVRLDGNPSLRDPNPNNLIVALLDGLPEHDFPGMARMQAMPAFADEADDAGIAALATWLRRRYGGQARAVTPADVHALRSNPPHH